MRKNDECEELVQFFDRNLNQHDGSIVSEEFLCPYGVRAAFARKQVAVIKSGGKIVAGVRFYPRKTDEVVSVYQFAVDAKHRGKGLLLRMLQSTGYTQFESVCTESSGFNEYYEKTGWKLVRKDDGKNYWHISI